MSIQLVVFIFLQYSCNLASSSCNFVSFRVEEPDTDIVVNQGTIDCRNIAWTCSSRNICRADVATGAVIGRVKEPGISCIDTRGEILDYGTSNGLVKIWDIRYMAKCWLSVNHDEAIKQIKIRENGEFILLDYNELS